MSKKKKRSTPAAAPAEPAKAEHTQPEEPAVSSTARWMGALCYLSILILIPACTKWRQDEFVRFHLNQGLMVLMLATICAALGFVPVLEQVALSLTLLVDVLSLGGAYHGAAPPAAPCRSLACWSRGSTHFNSYILFVFSRLYYSEEF